MAMPHLSALRTAEAATPDASSFALCRRAKALYIDLRAAKGRLYSLETTSVGPGPPQSLIVREIDHKVGPRITTPIGEALAPKEIRAFAVTRQTMINIYNLIDWGSIESNPRARDLLRRAAEIEAAGKQYNEDLDAADEAIGLSQTQAEVERLNEGLESIGREIAFMRALS